MSPERKEVSIQELAIVRVLRESELWLSNAEIAVKADVVPRTVRAHTRRLAQLGLIEQALIFPGHRFRWNPKAQGRHASYLQRLEHAAAVIGTHAKARGD